MKFSYGYKTSDGERHEGVIRAASREAVYAKLKADGIKPFGVEMLPGLANVAEAWARKWGLAFGLGLALVVVVAAFVFSGDGTWTPSPAYERLAADADALVKSATDFDSAREQLRTRFRASYPTFDAKEREEVQALYGRMMLALDVKEDNAHAAPRHTGKEGVFKR